MGGIQKKAGGGGVADEAASAARPSSKGAPTPGKSSRSGALPLLPTGAGQPEPSRRLILPDANHPARNDADGAQVVQTGKVTGRGIASIGGSKAWKALATATESVDIEDSSGDRLHVDATYRLETRPPEVGDLPDIWIHTERKALMTAGSGEHAGATVVGQARVELPPDAPLDPRAAISMVSIGPSHWGTVYLAEAEQYVPLHGSGGGRTLVADAAGSDVLAYDDALRMLVGLKNVLKQQRVEHRGAAVAAMHAKAKKLLDEARLGRAWLEKALDDSKTHHDHPTTLPIQWLVVDIAEWLAQNKEEGRDQTEDARLLRQAHAELRSLLEAVARAKPPQRDPVMDLAEAPGRFLDRTAKGLVEVGAMAIDAVALGVDALGVRTGIGSFDYHPLSSYGKSIEQSGAGPKAALVAMVNGFADQWSDALERAGNGDYRGLADISIDTLMMIDGARTGATALIEKGDEIVSRFATLAKSARALAARLPAEAGEAAAIARAMADGANAFVAEVISGGVELATPGGPPVPGGVSFAKAKGAAIDAFRARRFGEAKGAASKALRQTIGRAKAPDADKWLARVEALFEGDANAGTRFLEKVEQHTRTANPAPLMRKLDAMMADRTLTPSDLREVLSTIFEVKGGPLAVLDEIEWLSTRSISAEACSTLAKRAAKGEVDLAWVKRTRLTDEELNYLGLDKSTSFREFEAISDVPSRRNPGRLADRPPGQKALEGGNAKVRGIAGELAAQDLPLPNGLKIERRITDTATSATDYELRGPNGPAELEVKATRPSNWKKELDDYEAMLESGTPPTNQVARLLRQVAGARSRGREVYVAISDGTSLRSRERLLVHLAKVGVDDMHLLRLPESEILRIAKVLREHMGIEQPGFPGVE